MEKSLLYEYSLGYVVEDIKEDNPFVNIYPVERMPGYSGDISENIQETTTTTDINGKLTNVKINRSVKILAKWFNNGDSNRLTPPNVCKGETVMIYRYGDTDRFYWSTIFNELDLRKLEKATYVYSNKRSIEEKGTLLKAYYWTIDTINKFVKLHTDDTDGELTWYDIEINTKEGMITVEDGRGNYIQLDSSEDTYNLSFNKDGNLKIGRNRNVDIIDDDTLNIGGNRTTTVGGIDKLTVAGDSVTEVGGSTTATSTGPYTVTAPGFSMGDGATEIMATLVELLDANLTEQHKGNLDIPTSLMPDSAAKYEAVKAKLVSLMAQP